MYYIYPSFCSLFTKTSSRFTRNLSFQRPVRERGHLFKKVRALPGILPRSKLGAGMSFFLPPANPTISLLSTTGFSEML